MAFGHALSGTVGGPVAPAAGEFGFAALQLGNLGPSLFFQTVLNGLVLGMTLVLVSLGLSLIFGLAGVVNFSHGALVTIGVYATWVATTVTGSLAAGFVFAFIAVSVIGAAFERGFLTRVYDENLLSQVLLTYGFALFLEGAVIAIWGSTPKSLALPAWGTESIALATLSLPTYRVFIVLSSATIVVLAYLTITRTNIGLVIRAGIEDKEMVQALGINASRSFLVTFVVGAGLAGIAGALIAPIQGVYPTIGANYLILAFVAVVVGGLGSFKGSVISGVLIGQIIAFTGLTFSRGENVIVFLFMALMLLLRPRGLFGRSGVFD